MQLTQAPDALVMRIDGNGAPAAGWPAAGRVLGEALETTTSVALSASAGSVIAAWTASDDGGALRALRLDPEGNASAYWPEGGIALAPASGKQFLPAILPGDPATGSIVPDGRGGAIVFWIDHRDPATPRLYAQRVSKNGIVAPRSLAVDGDCGPKNWITRAFPTPTRGAITIEAYAPNESPVRFEVYDVRGRLRLVTRVPALPGPAVLPIRLDLSSLQPGIYFVRYLGSGSSAPRGARRVVVAR
jgi:hypothetical protein